MVTNREVTTIQKGAVANALVLEITPLVEGEQVGGRPDEQVLVQGIVGSPEGRALGSLGDIMVRQDTPQLWQKITGVRTRTGWVRLHSGGDPSMQDTYVTSGGADPTIGLTPALGPLSINGAVGLPNILALRRSTGVDAFVVAETGDLAMIGVLSLSTAGTVDLLERGAVVGAPAPAHGRLWLRSDAPNVLMFTDDDGTDFVIGGAPSAETWATTLLAGASSGATSPSINTGQNLLSQTGGGADIGLVGTRFGTFFGEVLDLSGAATVGTTLGVVGDATLESDLILDGATGAGDIDMAGDFRMDSASPAAFFGDAIGSPLLLVFKAAAATSQMFWRTSLGGAVVGDKAIAHTPTEDLEIRGHDGVGFNALLTLATALVTTNVAANFDAAVTMDTTLGVVGDATLESDLILDGATGAGDLTMAGDFLMDSASPTATIGDDLGAPTLELRKEGALAGVINYFSDNVLRAALLLDGSENFAIRVGATGTEFAATFTGTSGRWLMPANLRVMGVDLDIQNANARFTLGLDNATLVSIRRIDAASATPGVFLIEGGAHIGGGAADFSGGNLTFAAGNTDDTGAAAAGGTLTFQVGTTLGGGGPGTIELAGATNVTGDASVSGALEIDGFLNHDGANIGFYGVAPAVRPAAYTRTATVVETRTLAANASATAANNNAVIAQILEDLASTGILAVA